MFIINIIKEIKIMHGKVKIIIATIMIVMGSIFFTSVSQGQEVTPRVKKGYSMFGIGSSIVDIKALNSRIENKGYSKISDNFISLGGGDYKIINKMIIGGEGYGLIGEETVSGSYKRTIEGGYGFFNLGYILYSTNNLRIYPFLGLGYSTIDLKIIEKGTSSPSFDDVLGNPKRGVDLTINGFCLNLAFETDYLLKIGRDEKKEKELILGLRAGYILTPFKGDWEMSGINISDGPKIGITGPYTCLMIGIGGFGKE